MQTRITHRPDAPRPPAPDSGAIACSPMENLMPLLATPALTRPQAGRVPRPLPAHADRALPLAHLRLGPLADLPAHEPVLAVYLASGGVATGDEVVGRLRGHVEQPLSRLARWIVARDVVVLPWVGAFGLPLFQFDFAHGRVRPELAPVMAELRGVFDDADIASWWATPNTLLSNRCPLELLRVDAARVHEVARLDRFIAAG